MPGIMIGETRQYRRVCPVCKTNAPTEFIGTS